MQAEFDQQSFVLKSSIHQWEVLGPKTAILTAPLYSSSPNLSSIFPPRLQTLYLARCDRLIAVFRQIE